MTERFGEGTSRLVSLASRALGWGPTEFWQATPFELMTALSDQRQSPTSNPPSRETIERLMERDADG